MGHKSFEGTRAAREVEDGFRRGGRGGPRARGNGSRGAPKQFEIRKEVLSTTTVIERGQPPRLSTKRSPAEDPRGGRPAGFFLVGPLRRWIFDSNDRPAGRDQYLAAPMFGGGNWKHGGDARRTQRRTYRVRVRRKQARRGRGAGTRASASGLSGSSFIEGRATHPRCTPEGKQNDSAEGGNASATSKRPCDALRDRDQHWPARSTSTKME